MKIFSLPAQMAGDIFNISDGDKKKLDLLEQDAIDLVNTHSAEHNSDFFDSEVDKLDKWADDVKTALELELKNGMNIWIIYAVL